MNNRDLAFSAETAGIQDDVRVRVAAALLEQASSIASDAAVVLPFTASSPVDVDCWRRIGAQVVELLAAGIRDGRVGLSGGRLADLHRTAGERGLAIEPLFAAVYLIERTALDALSSSRDLGASTDSGPMAAQLVRRASFDVLAAYASRMQAESGATALVDGLTTAWVRPLFDAVLEKELERAERFETNVSVILFDVDELSAINRQFGHGVGDRILERLGIMIQTFFRRQDWVARFADDSFAVLLTATDPDAAFNLADRLRATVQERLEVTDHRSGQPIAVTVSAVVISVAPNGDAIDRERLVAEAEGAMARAKRAGRNRVERAVYTSRSS